MVFFHKVRVQHPRARRREGLAAGVGGREEAASPARRREDAGTPLIWNPKTRKRASPETARIARDRPDILERMQAGEYKSGRVGALARRCTADALYHYLYSHLDGQCPNALARSHRDRALGPAGAAATHR